MLDNKDVLGSQRDENRNKMIQANEEIPKQVWDEVTNIINQEFTEDKLGFGVCHQIWNRKVELFKERGYDWYSPKMLNPM